MSWNTQSLRSLFSERENVIIPRKITTKKNEIIFVGKRIEKETKKKKNP